MGDRFVRTVEMIVASFVCCGVLIGLAIAAGLYFLWRK